MRRWTVTAAMAMATDTTHFTGGDVATDQLLTSKEACKASETVQTMLVAEAAHANYASFDAFCNSVANSLSRLSGQNCQKSLAA